MLILGRESTCDVCLECYNNTTKIPVSIVCGHVFCLDCVNKLTHGSCPLCRQPFQISAYVKLHVDLEDEEAQRLMSALNTIATQGADKATFETLSEQCRTFLKDKPRSLYESLRLCWKMMGYMAKMKGDLKEYKQIAQNKAVLDGEMVFLREEVEAMKHQRDLAQSRCEEMEKVHQKQLKASNDAYMGLMQRYEAVISQWERAKVAMVEASKAAPIAFSEPVDAFVPPRIADPTADNDFLISPLSIFAGKLPKEDTEGLPELATFDHTKRISLGAAISPLQAERSDSLSSFTQSSDSTDSSSSAETTDLEEESRETPPAEAETPAVVPDEQPAPLGGLSLTAPKSPEPHRHKKRRDSGHRRSPARETERDYEHRELNHRQHHHKHRSRHSDESPQSRLMPNERAPPSTATSTASTVISGPENLNSGRTEENTVLRSRLADLLTDPNSPSISSSLPILPASHFPAPSSPVTSRYGSARETGNKVRPPLRSATMTADSIAAASGRDSNKISSASQLASSGGGINIPSGHRSSPSVPTHHSGSGSGAMPSSLASTSGSGSYSQRVSHASAAAHALEKAQKERQQAEQRGQQQQHANSRSRSHTTSAGYGSVPHPSSSVSPSPASRPGPTPLVLGKDEHTNSSSSASIPRRSGSSIYVPQHGPSVPPSATRSTFGIDPVISHSGETSRSSSTSTTTTTQQSGTGHHPPQRYRSTISSSTPISNGTPRVYG